MTGISRNGPRAPNGSAAVELVLIVPFAFVLMAAIVDLRSFAMHRTDIDRELYTVAEIVSGSARWSAASAPAALRKIGLAAADRLRGCPISNTGACGHTSGWLRVAVVVRPKDDPGDPTATPPVPATPATNSAGALCNPTAGTAPFCEPEMLHEIDFDTMTTGIQRIEWGGGAGDGNQCATTQSGMPANEGDQFAADAVVLPNEAADPDGDGPASPPARADWISRNIAADEWWTVVEACTHFSGGTSTPSLFQGGMTGFALETLDVAGSGAHARRVAWGSIESLDGCIWCEDI